MIWTRNRSVGGQQGISNPVSLQTDLLGGLFSPSRVGSTILTYTGLYRELEHLKIETRLIGESFKCVMGESVI